MSLSPEALRSLARLLDEAQAIDAAEQPTWVECLHEQDAELRPILEQMLAEEARRQRSQSRIDGGAFVQAGEEVGPYTLIRLLGRGGMGEVWLARRTDGTLKREIALKLPHLASGAHLARRMARERDIAAMLEHPSIARLYDAGVDAQGRPYLALESIDGLRLDRWCRERTPALRERLRLFVQIVRAVAYAHSRLVVHRDLKPSNVLVSSDGNAHLLDFGIARLLDDTQAGDSPAQAPEPGRALTPRYAAPEQRRGECATPASDIYALGVMLYEMLCGQHPWLAPGQDERTLDRAVALGPAPPPSTRVDDAAAARALRGELDAIVAKALQPEASARYATADALAEDVQRHLDGERVLAHPDTWPYRLRRIWRHHRTPILAGSTITAALVVASVVSIVQASRALQASERERLVKEFVAEMFRARAPMQAAVHPESPRHAASRLLQDEGRAIDTRFQGQPQLQAELYEMVARVFSQMGAYELAVQYGNKQLGVLHRSSAPPQAQVRAALQVGHDLLAAEQVRQAQALVQPLLSTELPDALRRSLLVLAARIQFALGQAAEQQALMDQADAMHGAHSAVDDAWLQYLHAQVDRHANRVDESIAHYRRAIDLARPVGGPPSVTAALIRQALAADLLMNGRRAEGIAELQRSLTELRAMGDAGTVQAARVGAELARLMFSNLQADAQQTAQAIARSRADLASVSILVPEALSAQIDISEAGFLTTRGEFGRAGTLLREALPAVRAGVQSPQLLFRAASAACSHALHADWTHFEEPCRWRLELRRQYGGQRLAYAVLDYAFLVNGHVMAGDFAKAQQVLAEAPSLPAASAPRSAWTHADALAWAQVRLIHEQGDRPRALQMSEMLPNGGVRWGSGELRAQLYCDSRRAREGYEIARAVLADPWWQSVAEASPELARSRAVAGLCALAAGDPQAAQEMARLAQAAFEAQPDVNPWLRKPLDLLQARLAVTAGGARRLLTGAAQAGAGTSGLGATAATRSAAMTELSRWRAAARTRRVPGRA